MFVHMGTHFPKEDQQVAVEAAMKRFAQVAAAQPGSLQVITVAEVDGPRRTTITVWGSRADFDAALPALRESIADVPWDDWQTRKTDVQLSEAIFAAGALAESFD